MISIITSTYNSEKTLSLTFESLINQSFLDFEYIIVDGKSTDNTIKIIKEYEAKFKKKNISYKWISEKDSGIYDAWNKGIKIATGKWIGFLGSDDIYYFDALKSYNNLLINNSHLDYISSKVKLVDGNKLIKNIDGKWSWKVFKKYMNVAHVGSLHSKQYFEKYGYYNINYKIAGDYEMLLRAKRDLKYYFLDKFTVEMSIGGVSNDFIYQTLNEAKKAKITTGSINKFYASIYLFWALVKYYLKLIIK